MLSSYRAEALKLVRWPAMWVLAAVLLVPAQVFGYLIPYVGYRSGGGSGFAAGETQAQLLADILPANLVGNTLSGFPMFAGALALIIGALAAGSEYGWGTLKTILTQRPGRSSVLVGKVLAMTSVIFILVIVLFALNSFWSWVIAQSVGRPADWPSASDLVGGIATGWLILGCGASWAYFSVHRSEALRWPSASVSCGHWQ